MSENNKLSLQDELTEFLLYTTPNGDVKIDILFYNENVWLTQKRMAELFNVEVNTINYHLKEAFKSGELDETPTIRKIRTVQIEGVREVSRDIEFYNLDAIISVGYRVNSSQATQFRIWANNVLENGNNSPLEGWQTKSDGVFSTKVKFNKYSQLPYNPKLKEKAKQLRKSGNLSEVLFWNKVKNKQVLNLDFERQKIIGNYIVDFYCTELNLIIEIDGESHDFKGEYDNVRDNYLRNLGLKVLHIEDIRVKNDLDSLINEIYKLVFQLKQENTPSNLRFATPQEGNLGNSQSVSLSQEGNFHLQQNSR